MLLKKHEKTHTSEKKYKCTSCPATFNILSNHVLHLATHNTENPVCPECGKKFQRIASLKAHIVYHTKEETFYCDECDVLFNNEAEMNEHVEIHTQVKKEEVKTCKYCSSTFTDPLLYRKHISEHNKLRSILQSPNRKKPRRTGNIERKHKCNICTKAFQKQSQIDRHMRVHSGEKPFICKVCDRGFSQKGSLQIHMSRHTGIKPYKCILCEAKFSQKGNLRVHILKTHTIPHTDEKVYCCTECSCIFKSLGSLNCHMTRNHPKDKENDLKYVMSQLSAIQNTLDSDILQQAIDKSSIPNNNNQIININQQNNNTTDDVIVESSNLQHARYVTLADLGSDGNTRQYLIRQRKVGEVRWYICAYCPKEFKKPSDLLRHLRVHTREKPYGCTYCGRSFAIKSTLTTHLKVHTKCTKIQCKHCNKFFSSWNSLNGHIIKHTGAPKIKCNICNKLFRSKAQLNKHHKIHLKNDLDYYKESSGNTVMLQPIQITSRGLEPVTSLRKRPILEAGCKTRPHMCKICGGGFRKLSHLKQHHILKHTRERPYSCQLCHRTFGSTSILNSHLATHNNYRPFFCVVCNKSFTTKGSLKRHMVVHSVTKPYICPTCFLDFKTLTQCKKHIETHTSTEITLGSAENVEATTELIDQEVNEVTYCGNYTLVPPVSSVNLSTNPTEIMDQINNTTNVLPSNYNLPQENIQEIDNSLNTQMLNIIGSEDSYPSTTSLDVGQSIVTTNELVETLTNGSANNPKLIDDNQLQYSQVIVNLAPDSAEQIQMFDNNGIDNIVLQNDQLFLTDINSVNMNQGNNVLLPFQISTQTDIQQQNQLVLLPPSEIDANIAQAQQSAILNNIQTAAINNLQPTTTLNKLPTATISNIQQVTLNNIQSSADEQNLQLNAMNGFLSGVDDNINTILNTAAVTDKNDSAEFLNCNEPPDTIIDITASLPDKSLEDNLLENVMCSEKTTDNSKILACDLCKAQLKNEHELKMHQCVNLIGILLNHSDIDINNANNNNNIGEDNNMIANDDTVAEETVVTTTSKNDNIESLNVNLENKKNTITKKEFDEFVSQKTEEQQKKKPSKYQNKYKHQCVYCQKSFQKPSDLQRHLRTHTGERPFKCNECDKSFSLKSTLETHSKVHDGTKEFPCLVCNSLFSSRGSLNVHMRLHTGVKPFKCQLCNLKFRTSGQRKSHLTVHYKEILKTGKLSADNVQRKTKMTEIFKNVENSINENLNNEQEVNANKDLNEIQLDIQNIQFDPNLQVIDIPNDKSNNMHYEIEMNSDGQIVNIKPTASNVLFIDDSSKKLVVSTQIDFDDKTKEQIENFVRDKADKRLENKNKQKKICTVCQKGFNTKYLLDRHSRIHTGERSFSCNYCSKTFNQKSSLKVHVPTHFGNKPYSCPYCSNAFNQIGNLKTHVKRIHSNVRPEEDPK